MMRKFSTIVPTIWTSPTGREWRRLGRDHQVLGLYLITNPHANLYGLYYLPMVIIAEETGITRAPALKVLQSFADQEFAYYDERSEWIWVANMAARQLHLSHQPNPSEPRIVGLRRWYSECPSNPFLGPFYDHYHELFHMNDRRDGGKASAPTVTTALVPVNGARTLAVELFERFWSHYPKPVGKKAALNEWMAIKPTPDEAFTAKCIEAVERQKRSRDWIKEAGAYIPEPERWLKKGRWEDRAPELPMLSEGDVQRAATLATWTPRHDDE